MVQVWSGDIVVFGVIISMNLPLIKACLQDPSVSLLMLLINVDERALKIRPRSNMNADEIGSQSDPSLVTTTINSSFLA